MRVPGTTIEISLKTNRIYVVDKSITKRVEYAGRTLKEVLEEIQRFAYMRGFNTPSTILKFILKRIGLPDVDVFPTDDDLTKDDILEFSRALNVVESLSDQFLSPSGTSTIPDEIKNIYTNVAQSPEAAKPQPVAVTPERRSSIWDDVPQSEEATKLIYSFHWENLPVNTPTPRTEAKSKPKKQRFNWDEPVEVEGVKELAPEGDAVHTSEVIAETDEELLQLKVLFLGEQRVGVKSILFECNLKLGHHEHTVESSKDKPYIYSNVVDHDGKNVQVNVWTFEKSMEARLPRTDFFTGSGIAVIVYSSADRWSFDSLDFWMKELSNTFLIPPPVIIVGNKADLRDSLYASDEEEFETPVTTEEGREFCTRAAKQLGVNGQSHPLLFMETSSVTGQGIAELLNNIVDLWLTNERPSMPAVESHTVSKSTKLD